RAFPDQHVSGLRPQPAAEHPGERCADAGAAGLPGGPSCPEDSLDGRLHEGTRRRQVPRWDSPAAARRLRARRTDDDLPGRSRSDRRARRSPAQLESVLPDELHQAAALPLRRRLLRVARGGAASPTFNTSVNADAQIWFLMAILSLAFVSIPFIPGLRGLPRHLGVHRLIWRDHYRRVEGDS